jgi:WD40 repeat protein
MLVGEAPIFLRYRPDGGTLAVATSKNRLEIRGLNGKVLQGLQFDSRIFGFDWNGDGRQIAVANGNRFGSVWDVSSGRQISVLRGHQAEVVEAFFMPTGNVVATWSWDETARLWNSATGELLLVADSRIFGFSRSGRHLGFVKRDTIGTFKVLNDEYFSVFYGHEGKSPRWIDLSPDGQFLVSGGGDGVILWEVETGRKLASVPAGVISALAFTAAGNEFLACGPDGLSQWALDRTDLGTTMKKVSLHSTTPCRRMAASADTNHIVVSQNQDLGLVGSGQVRQIEGFRGIAGLRMSQDGKWIAAGSWRGDRVQVWDTRDGEVAAVLLRGTPTANVEFSPNGQWIVTSTSSDYRLFKTGSWEEVRAWDRPPRYSNLAGTSAFTTDGAFLALRMSEMLLQVFSVPDGEVVSSLGLTDPQSLTDLVFSSTGDRLFAACSGNRILVWKLDEIREKLHQLGLDEGRRELWPSSPQMGTRSTAP